MRKSLAGLIAVACLAASCALHAYVPQNASPWGDLPPRPPLIA